MSEKRFKYEDRPLTEKEAIYRRVSEIKNEVDEIKHLEGSIQNCKNRIFVLESKPLETTIRTQTPFIKGQEGYDECPPNFNEIEFIGEYKWIKDHEWINIPK